MSEFPLPNWWDNAQGEWPDCERNRFKIRLAALYFTPKGDVMNLSYASGIPRTTLQLPCLVNHKSSVSGQIWPNLALKLENTLNSPHFTRKFFRPDLFG